MHILAVVIYMFPRALIIVAIELVLVIKASAVRWKLE